jgi:hypothetical protein
LIDYLKIKNASEGLPPPSHIVISTAFLVPEPMNENDYLTWYQRIQRNIIMINVYIIVVIIVLRLEDR